MNFEKLYQNRTVQLLIVAFIAAIFVRRPEALLQADLDSAVRWASNHLFALKSPYFDIFPHTNGPLFFLKFPIPEGNRILISVLFDFATKFILGYYLLQLSKQYRSNNYWLPIVILIGFASLFYLDFIIIAIVLACCLLAFRSDIILEFLPGIAILVISIFIKASISFPALLIFGSTILVLLFYKKHKLALALSLSFIAILFTLIAILYDSFLSGITWLINSFISTLSYGSDQAIHFNNFLPYIILTVLFILIVPFLIKNKQTRIFYLVTLLSIFAIWKYSLGRQDFTHYRAWFLMCILLAAFVVMINNKRAAIIGAACYFLSLGFFITNTKRGDSPKEMVYTLPEIDFLPKTLLAKEKVNQRYKEASHKLLWNTYLSDSILNIIGTQTVDVFPWDLSVLYKYPLNYKPRPNFHSTILGKNADLNEAKYFASAEAPKLLLWHKSQPGLFSLNGHNQVYLPNAVSHSFKSLLANYKFVRAENGYALWKKTSSKQETTSTKGKIDIQFNKWFSAPKTDSNTTIFAQTNLTPSSLSKLKSFLYKGDFFKIDYKLADGNQAWHFISQESLQRNFLVQPYFTDPSMNHIEINEIMITPMEEKYSNKNLSLEWESKSLN